MIVSSKEIYLVQFPYSDFSLKKIRPVLIVSNEKYNQTGEDVIICGISSKLRAGNNIKISTKDLEEGELHKESIVKCDALLKVKKAILRKKIGMINEKANEKVREKIISLF